MSDEQLAREVTVAGATSLTDEEIEEIVEEWNHVQITIAETGEVIHDSF